MVVPSLISGKATSRTSWEIILPPSSRYWQTRIQANSCTLAVTHGMSRKSPRNYAASPPVILADSDSSQLLHIGCNTRYEQEVASEFCRLPSSDQELA